MKRDISIRNAHPRLSFPRDAVIKAIRLLDEKFEMLPADLALLSLPRPRLQSLKSQITDLKSEPRSVLPPGELSLVLLTDAALAKIHGDFMNDPTATDVITFDGDPLSELAGEICVSADTAAKYVGLPSLDKLGTLSLSKRLVGRPASVRRPAPTLQNTFAAELTLYLVHGWLHLAGYDDLQPAKKRRMRAAEARAMKLLTEADTIPAFRLI